VSRSKQNSPIASRLNIEARGSGGCLSPITFGSVSYLGDGVSLAVVGDGGRGRAVSGVGSHDLGGVRDVAGPGKGASGSGKNGDGGELHFD